METAYSTYLLEQLKNLLAIDSTTGDYAPMQRYLCDESARLGYAPRVLHKGGVQVDLGGAGDGLVIAAHADDIGLMVRAINPDGTLRVHKVGGLHPFQCDLANVRVYTRAGRTYTGTMRRRVSSLHLMSEADRTALPDYEKNLYLFLDEDVRTAADAAALGIGCGDFVAVDPGTVFTDSGYIKSRFLDDKASVAAILALMKWLKDTGTAPRRHLTALFTLYEEVGHGGSVGLPEDTKDFIAVDIGCCAPGYASDERKVTIGVMDAYAPYHRGLIDELVAAAEGAGVAYALDMPVPSYGSDADAALRAGWDVRHGLIGPGVLGTHGYERTHVKALEATFELMRAYVIA
ncbi:MAG: M20/M25/M40 family metallo-hydrolase [Oscillospiraceae bacterium]|jgi:putative aminopeptidase FrvX|nr:M20/M25/M40 family metallo-hydrolase [Oscillospiraceae bacterium]